MCPSLFEPTYSPRGKGHAGESVPDRLAAKHSCLRSCVTRMTSFPFVNSHCCMRRQSIKRIDPSFSSKPPFHKAPAIVHDPLVSMTGTRFPVGVEYLSIYLLYMFLIGVFMSAAPDCSCWKIQKTLRSQVALLQYFHQ